MMMELMRLRYNADNACRNLYDAVAAESTDAVERALVEVRHTLLEIENANIGAVLKYEHEALELALEYIRQNE